MYNIFKFEKSEKEYCPDMIPLARKETMTILNMEEFNKNKTDVNNDGNAMVVIGYWKPWEKDETQQKYVSYITIDAREKEGIQHIYMLECKDKTLMVMQTTTDTKGCSISDEEEQIKGSLMIKGVCKEEFTDDSDKSRRMLMRLSNDLSLPPDKSLRVFSATFLPGQKPNKRKKRNKKTTQEKADKA